MSELIVWNDDLKIGLDEIDNQHHELVKLLNQLNEAIRSNQGSAVANRVLDELHDYTRIHFAVEESIMRMLDYPDYIEHKAKHEKLENELLGLSLKFREEGKAISFELLHFLKNWLTKHIQESDREYSSHFIKTGIQASNRFSNNNRSGWMGNLLGKMRTSG